MGGSVSSGRNNDELVDNLVKGGLIKTQIIERVFRAVDRGIFYLPKFKDAAYRDLAWREGRIHISAPCIYTRVMESFELEPNLSFLNIGSGTGYLSTMVGLILGSNGVNHNIEIFQEIIDYSKQRIKEFVKTAAPFDDFDFCIPKFVHGNFLNLNHHGDLPLYDRVYVGMGVSDEHENLLKNLIKVNGILIMPLNDSLIKIKRIDENNWETSSLMTVSFASLITTVYEHEPVNLPLLKPLTLQEICRFRIRQIMRDVIEKENVDYYKIKREMSTFNTQRIEKLKKKHEENNLDEDDDEEDSNETSNESEFPLTRFERLFTPDRRGQINSNDIPRNNSYFENQLRLMIYGRLIDPTSANSLAIAFNPETNEETTTDEEIDDEIDSNNDEEESLSSIETEEATVELKHEESLNKSDIENDIDEIKTSTNVQQTSQGSVEEEKMVGEEEAKETEKTTAEEAIIEETSNESSSGSSSTKLKSHDSICESGFSETEHESKYCLSTLSFNKNKRTKNNSNGYYTSENDGSCSSNEVEMIKEKDQIDLDEAEEILDAQKDDNDVLAAKDSNEENEYEESETSEMCYDGNRKSTNVTEVQTNQSSDSENENPLPKIQSPLSDVETKPIEISRENLLRTKILKLPLSMAIKMFLLYNREI